MGDDMTKTRYVTLLATGAALGGFLFGSDTSAMNGALPGIEETLDIGPGALGFIAAVSLLGCATGAWFAGGLAERRGRTSVMAIGGSLIAVGAIGAALSSRVIPLGVCRLVVGVGIGGLSAMVPGYIVEIAPAAIRGRLGSLWQLALIVGQLLGLLGALGLAAWAGSEAAPLPWGGAAWRWMFAGVGVCAAAYVMIARALPPSAPDALRRGRPDDARRILDRTTEARADEEVAAIAAAQSGRERPGLAELRGSRLGLRPIVWAGILLAALQQLVGINVVKTYSNTLWQSVGFSKGSAFTVSIITVAVSFVSTLIAMAVVDRVGRRTMLGAGAGVMFVSLAALAVAFSTTSGSGDDTVLSGGASLTALVAMNVFALGFGVTWGPVMWVMLSELFKSDIRTVAVAVCTAVNWTTNWAVTQSFPHLASLGLGVTYGLYAAFSALAFVFVWKVLPETRGREID
jgi:MFS transporter, SP family, sugar:H+ symporter